MKSSGFEVVIEHEASLLRLSRLLEGSADAQRFKRMKLTNVLTRALRIIYIYYSYTLNLFLF